MSQLTQNLALEVVVVGDAQTQLLEKRAAPALSSCATPRVSRVVVGKNWLVLG